MVESKSAFRKSRFGNFVRRLQKSIGNSADFSTSADYWEHRYRSGGNSGAGSYNRLAAFKAEILNDFVTREGLRSVIEFGVGDGTQLRLAQYPSYVGVDVSETVVGATRKKFANDRSIEILHTSEVSDQHRAELALSLDVIYHLVEDDTFDTYMRQLFAAATRYVVIYASNFDSAWPDPHVRHREFTRWVNTNQVGFQLAEVIENRYPYSKRDPHRTSFANFYFFSKSDITLDTMKK